MSAEAPPASGATAAPLPLPRMAVPRVAVLLSTYNGERYLAEQLASLRRQEGVALHVHARDDGSTDGTCAILRAHAPVWPELADLAPGTNLGVAASFLHLLGTAPADADFYAFCDQDDVWMPDKLARATAALAAEEGPALYCSNTVCVDHDLKVIGTPAPHPDARFHHILFDNVATGCTVVLNRAARELLVSRLPESGVLMHDWWCALVIAAFGRLHYDPVPSMFYRQHGGNVVGLNANWLGQKLGLMRRLLRQRRTFYPIHAQAAELLRQFGPTMPAPHRDHLARLVESKRSLAARAAFALSRQVVHRDLVGQTAVRGLILANWY